MWCGVVWVWVCVCGCSCCCWVLLLLLLLLFPTVVCVVVVTVGIIHHEQAGLQEARGGPNPFARFVEDCGGLDAIEALQSHEDQGGFRNSTSFIPSKGLAVLCHAPMPLDPSAHFCGYW